MKKRVSLIWVTLLTISMVFSAGVNVNVATVPSKATLLNTYENVFEKVRVAIPAYKMSDKKVMSATKRDYNSELTMRGHTLVWHSQTPEWYFKTGYNKNSGYVNQSTMNKRMEF